MIAEMIVPIEQGKDRYFSDNARTIVTGILLYIVVNMDKENRHLGTLYRLLRLSGDDWLTLLAEMQQTENPLHHDLLEATAQEILKLMKSGENSFRSIMATTQQCTNFLKSPAMQKSLQSGYDPSELAAGKSTLLYHHPCRQVAKPRTVVTPCGDQHHAGGYPQI